MTEELDVLVDKLSNLKVMDLAKLKKMLEEKWGVSAASMQVAAAPAAKVEEGKAASAEPTEFQVILEDVPAANKIGVIKVIREATGLPLKEAKDIAEATPPKTVKAGLAKPEATELVKKFQEAGAKASMKGV